MVKRLSSVYRRAPLSVALTGFFAASLLVISQIAAWDLGSGPTQTDRRITNLVTRYLRTDHLSKHPLDDEISERAIKLFLKTLDPLKSYFLQSDIDEFMKHRTEIDDKLKEQGDISLAY